MAPKIIKNEHNIVRLCKPAQITGGRATSEAFRLQVKQGHTEEYLSVALLEHNQNLTTITDQKNAVRRQLGNSYKGITKKHKLAKVNVGRIKEVGAVTENLNIDIQNKPSKKYSSHSGVCNYTNSNDLFIAELPKIIIELDTALPEE